MKNIHAIRQALEYCKDPNPVPLIVDINPLLGFVIESIIV